MERSTDGGHAEGGDRLRGRSGRPVRLSEDELKDLRKQVEKGGWHDVKTEDGTLSVYVGKVAFLRIDSGAQKVGFGLNRQD